MLPTDSFRNKMLFRTRQADSAGPSFGDLHYRDGGEGGQDGEREENERPELSLSFQATATVNVPASVIWTWTDGQEEEESGSGPHLSAYLVQDGSHLGSPTSQIALSISSGQTEGTFSFLPTQTGTYRLEVSGPDAQTEKISIIVIQPSSTGTPTRATATLTSPPTTITTTIMAYDDPQAMKLSIVATVLGTLFGVLAVLSLIILYALYHQRKSQHTALDRKKTIVSGHWWSSPQYKFGKGKETDVASQDNVSESLAPSDSVSQLGRKGKDNLYKQHWPLPLRPSTELTVISEKTEAVKHEGNEV
ncbi:hypothetical protein Moror_17920 [Moniliophthora roreri MCA 2997]|uniref:Uncharacterized protein n=2 Tax=Moniliophthora roreri TaxID=221103 RepID=V2XXF6_MONRO|nr:hypothetical protein Moror_17920 [Moniliophthora roreri MCA 2997]KAI3619381.1 hypothetical protein WG66_012904 [Moniliophthora roreri]